jgi:hypothetical protein
MLADVPGVIAFGDSAMAAIGTWVRDHGHRHMLTHVVSDDLEILTKPTAKAPPTRVKLKVMAYNADPSYLGYGFRCQAEPGELLMFSGTVVGAIGEWVRNYGAGHGIDVDVKTQDVQPARPSEEDESIPAARNLGATAGIYAAKAGLCAKNPFPEGTKEHAAWADGYRISKSAEHPEIC